MAAKWNEIQTNIQYTTYNIQLISELVITLLVDIIKLRVSWIINFVLSKYLYFLSKYMCDKFLKSTKLNQGANPKY